MKSQVILKNKAYSSKTGFTLIEILVVVTLLLIIGGASAYLGIDSFRGYSYHSDRDTLISALEHARALAMADICRGGSCSEGKPYGVAIRPLDHPGSYVIFQAEKSNPAYAPRTTEDKEADAIIDATIPTNSGEVVFDSLSGDNLSHGDTTFTLADDATHSSVITINSEGQISWTN